MIIKNLMKALSFTRLSTNTRRFCVRTFVVFLVMIFILSNQINIAQAVFNKQINYQGKLTNTSNVAVTNGTYHMKFNLYTTATGGVTLWTEDRSTAVGDRITVTNGLFSVMLGSSTPLTSVNFNQTLYLGVEIGGSSGSFVGDGEMTPRKVLGAVPASFVADTVDNISSEQFLRNDASNATSTASTFLTLTQSGAGKIAEFFGPSSASVLSITSTGNVGIGTTTPYAKLSVDGQGVFNQDVRANFYTATSTTATSTFAGGISGPNLFTVQSSSGRVGIGTTTPASPLNVNTAVAATTAYATLSVGESPWNGVSSGKFIGASGGTMIGVNSPNTSGISLIDLQTFGSSRFRVTSTGQVTIGSAGAQNGSHTADFALTPTGAVNLTSEGGQLFVVNGASFTITGSYANQKFNTFGQPTINADSTFSISTEASTFNISGAPKAARFATIARSVALRVNAGTAIASGVTDGYGLYLDAPTGATNNYAAVFAGGNVGIGTTTPWGLLSVNANALTSGAPQFVVGSSTATHFIVTNGGNVGIATTSPWRTFSASGTVAFIGLTGSAAGNALCILPSGDVANAGTGACTPSALRFKENIADLSSPDVFSKIMQLRAVSFDYRDGFHDANEGAGSYGLIAEEVEKIDPLLVDYCTDGQVCTIHFEKFTGLFLKAIQEMHTSINNLVTNVTDLADKVANFADTFTTKKLDVIGNVEAFGLTAKANRSAMESIVTHGEENYNSYLDKIKDINISTYQYKADGSHESRLGIISDNAPSEILSVNGDNVDIYKLATLTLGGVKALQYKFDTLDVRVTALENKIFNLTSTTSPITTSTGFMDSILSHFDSLGANISQGFAGFKKLITETLTVGSREKPTGITIYDDKTGEPYCLSISNGNTKTTAGECKVGSSTIDQGTGGGSNVDSVENEGVKNEGNEDNNIAENITDKAGDEPANVSIDETTPSVGDEPVNVSIDETTPSVVEAVETVETADTVDTKTDITPLP